MDLSRYISSISPFAENISKVPEIGSQFGQIEVTLLELIPCGYTSAYKLFTKLNDRSKENTYHHPIAYKNVHKRVIRLLQFRSYRGSQDGRRL